MLSGPVAAGASVQQTGAGNLEELHGDPRWLSGHFDPGGATLIVFISEAGTCWPCEDFRGRNGQLWLRPCKPWLRGTDRQAPHLPNSATAVKVGHLRQILKDVAAQWGCFDRRADRAWTMRAGLLGAASFRGILSA